MIDAGVERISEFGNDHLIPHFIICFGISYYSKDVKTFKEIFLPKMRRYGIRSAFLTILNFRRYNLKTKEAVKQQHLDSRKGQLDKEIKKSDLLVSRIISEDLELFYTNLQNPERQPKSDYASIFSTQKLTEEELTPLKNRDRYFLNTFSLYHGTFGFSNFNGDFLEAVEKSSDPDSIFSYSSGCRDTIILHVTLKSMEKEMRKRVANEDPSNMELKKQRVKWYSQNQYTYKFAKKE